MKIYLLLVSLLLSWPAFSQTTQAYQVFEVDSAAEPRGGVVFFNTFIQSTLRKPVSAQALGAGGRIVVEGIVEPNGHISNVKALQSLRPDCDREAVRAFSLFNAWKPAKKGGQAVRQRVTMPIMFQPNTPFTYLHGARITYFGADNKVVADSSQAQYKQMAPVDSNGVPTGDVVVYELKGKGWKEYFRLPLVRRKNTESSSPHKVAYTIGNQDHKKDWQGSFFIVDEDGTIIQQTFYQDSKPTGTDFTYHPNGAVAEKREKNDEKTAIMTWYANGQIEQIKAIGQPTPVAQSEPELLTAFWDSTGHQLVTNGNGRAIYQKQVRSDKDTTIYTLFVEQGSYENGFKQGNWTGRHADGSYFYEEAYDKGVMQSGKARSAGADTVRYTAVMQQPEFPGGMPGLGQFLSQNLSYPVTAQKAGAQGKVFVSFVVCTDGTLCDYEVLKSVQPDLDREAVGVVKKMSGKWKPGFHRGQKVRVKYNLPINFTLY
ncbi:TonB family protein [Spirosoma validum]|uniref:TonB family protein n=1 Tax=Spirosoma validum TaxID=2771355 RepID=A0A927AXB7_9BACT|nr:TonB family protein [Spirosoma validum]MBD2751505.1 TonB family protein [Spirosoma validum]